MSERFRYDSALEKVYDDDTYNGETTESYGVFECCEIMNELVDENEQLKKINKGQELEIVRLHHLADAMSGVLREFGIFDVFNKEAIAEALKRFLE